MATGTSPATKRAGTRKTANKLVRFAGGSETSDFLAAARDVDLDGGITAGLASIATAEGQRFIEAPTEAISPHPYNDPSRSTPQPDNPRWVELVNSVQAAGVQVPILVVSRSAFAEARPELEPLLGPATQYVIIYGHRRRAAAAAAGLATVPAVIDDSAMANGGDLDAMTIENLGREDLTDLQQAEMFARYSEAGFGQRAIAEKLGLNQSTVSRRLSLLLLAPDVLSAVERGAIKQTEAAELAGKLPFGPPRPWQQDVQSEQGADYRRTDQLAACELVAQGATPKRAAERVLAERRARQRAAAEGIEIIDPRERFGADYQRHAIPSPAAAGVQLVAAIDDLQGGLVYYPAAVQETPPSSRPSTPPGHDVSTRHFAAATRARRAVGARLVSSQPPRDKLLPLLAAQYASGVAALGASQAGWSLAFEYSRAAGLSSADCDDVAAYRTAAAGETALRRQLEVAWACAVAAFELNASDRRRQAWDHLDLAYLHLLQDRASYSPTPWEVERLTAAGGGHE
ncbi:ParB/RepB/Spo0J family partition protein [Mycobacterium sp. AT1]|uniref:ParB/RepB/Spo0J family partition protein n=1 Tax=Mycobacterium sp. AT1 TaxID=1961706 RepID=UPI0009AEC4AA|nr:ParB/RepB/Spo0J family partition protein [Mycobacterium sp. AT1]OPX05367.1 chromosome partitioning protein ParB [Mycobacterium sp. AT1]